ncbi:thermonuclease family protein [Nocardioides iriomotensis]|nr:thermonuclease family protein [Nocardioides iriomotensis]
MPILALFAGILSVLTMAPAQAYDRDCGDFATQRAAQIFFLNNGGPSSDPHGLDAEGDGIACESNPCPCLYKRSTGGGGQPSTDPKSGSGGGSTLTQSAIVIKVTDGDTIKVRLATGGTPDVRLIGIDTPEVYGGTECGGPEASASLKRILPIGTKVVMYSDPTQDLKDRYGRLLRYVHKKSTGKDVNRQQVYFGHATVYVYNNNPFKRTSGYKKAATMAKGAHRGIWGTC